MKYSENKYLYKKGLFVKIAINAVHGGFGLSAEAIKLYCKKTSTPCYFFNLSFKNKEEKYNIVLEPTEAPVGTLRWSAFTVPNPSDFNDSYKYRFDDSFKNDRFNKHLIETIEELGEKANGRFAKLKIVEVPDDVKWHISEYDGWEWVAENHRKWE